MRGSLRRLTLDRLGRIDEALVTRAVLPRGAGRRVGGDARVRAGSRGRPCRRSCCGRAWRRPTRSRPSGPTGVNLIGCDERFWQLGDGRWQPRAAGRQRDRAQPSRWPSSWASASATRSCCRLPRPGRHPGRKPAGPQSARPCAASGSRSATIIPAEGLGRFGLRPTQHAAAQRLCLAWPASKRNLASQAGPMRSSPLDRTAADAAQQATAPAPVRPKLDDYGIQVQAERKRSRRGTSTSRPTGCSSSRRQSGRSWRPWRTIPLSLRERAGVRETCRFSRPSPIWPTRSPAAIAQIPYSTVTAIDFDGRSRRWGRLVSPTGKPVAAAGRRRDRAELLGGRGPPGQAGRHDPRRPTSSRRARTARSARRRCRSAWRRSSSWPARPTIRP